MTTPENKRKPGVSSGNRPFHMGGGRPVAAPVRMAPPRRMTEPVRMAPEPVRSPRPQAPPAPKNPNTPKKQIPQKPQTPGRPGDRRPERIALPFENRRRKGDAGEWVYQHRVGLLVTVVLYLIAAILFVSYKIVVYENPSAMMYVDLVDPNELEQPKPEDIPQKPIEQIAPGSYERVTNRASDQNAKMDASLRDDRGTQSEKIYEEAQRVQQELAAGQQAFRSGMDEIAQMSSRHKMPKHSSSSSSTSSSSQRQTVKVQGNVTVSYDLAGRMATYLHVPAYQCREGGAVVVGITVNRNGEVVNAAVEKASPGECIADRAVQAALVSTFNADGGAPDRQRGTITYVFVAQ